MLRETAHALPVDAALDVPAGRARFSATLARHSVAFWLTGIVIVSAIVRVLPAIRTSAPWIVPDELVYTHLARSFADTGHFAIRGEPFSAWSFGPLYPILISPIFRVASPADAYLIVKVVNSVVFSLAAIPAYFLAQRVLTPRSALLLASLTLLVPSGIYTSKIMTESLSYPLFLGATLAIVRALEAPTAKRELLAIAAITAATLVRGQLVVLLPALVVTLVVACFLEQRDVDAGFDLRGLGQRLGCFPVTWLTCCLGLLALIVASKTGISGSIAGGHGEAFAGVGARSLVASFASHLAELDLYVGVLPFATMAMMCVLAVRRRSQDHELRVLSVLTLSLTVLLAAAAARYLVAVYAGSADPYLRVYDRYDFYVTPLFLIGFLVWLERRLPRPARVTIPVVGIAAALPLALPLSALLNGHEWGTSSSSVALVPWAFLRITTGTMLTVYATLVVAAVFFATLSRARSGRPLLVFVVSNFVVLNFFVVVANSALAHRALAAGLDPKGERSWIDAAAGPGANVSALWSGRKTTPKGWFTIWENEFFNKDVRRIYFLREPMRYDLPQIPLGRRGDRLHLANGEPFVAQYVLTDSRTPVAGARIAADTSTGMVLYRVEGPVSLR